MSRTETHLSTLSSQSEVRTLGQMSILDEEIIVRRHQCLKFLLMLGDIVPVSILPLSCSQPAGSWEVGNSTDMKNHIKFPFNSGLSVD